MKHTTVIRKGDEIPRPVRIHENDFKCPFCSPELYKPAGYPKIATHLASHKLKAINHRDYIIYGCGLDCDGKAKHFHCCYCSKTYINKREMLKHLDLHCPDGPCQPAAATAGSSTPGPSRPGPPGVPTPGSSTPGPSAVPTPGSSTPDPPAAATPGPSEAPSHTLGACKQPQIQRSEQILKKDLTGVVTRKQIYVQCPHCNLTVNKRNLKIHIERRHTLHAKT